MDLHAARVLARDMLEQRDRERREREHLKSLGQYPHEYRESLWNNERQHIDPQTGIPWNPRYLYRRIVRDGIRVVAEVRWDVPFATRNHPHIDPKNAYLAIYFQPLPGEYFPFRVPREPDDEQHGWHVSLIHSDDFDDAWSGEHERIMTHLIVRFHRQVLHLRFREPRGDEGTMDDASGLQFAIDDPVASDYVVQELRKTDYNRHGQRPMHLTI